jgi:hypothetical protein
VAKNAAPPSAPDQAGNDSKRANEFLGKCFDVFVATHPQIESSLGIKTHNDQWNDISHAAAKRDLEIAQGWGLYSELTPKEIGMYQDPEAFLLALTKVRVKMLKS